jgi:hypothetical protein
LTSNIDETQNENRIGKRVSRDSDTKMTKPWPDGMGSGKVCPSKCEALSSNPKQNKQTSMKKSVSAKLDKKVVQCNQTFKQLRQLMTGIITYLSVLTLNVNGINSPIKRHRLTKWIKKEDPTICCLQETHLTDRNKHRLRMKGWKKIYQASDP